MNPRLETVTPFPFLTAAPKIRWRVSSTQEHDDHR